jgi:3-dehydroquinate dehydratase-2
VLVIHGPNLNLLGEREKTIYGNLTLDEINDTLIEMGEEEDIPVFCHQSNHEGVIIDLIHNEGKDASVLIINPGAFTHTSVAIRDAILARDIKTIEVHMSNVYKREAFRHHSYLKDIVLGQVIGFGPLSYYLAMNASISIITGEEK